VLTYYRTVEMSLCDQLANLPACASSFTPSNSAFKALASFVSHGLPLRWPKSELWRRLAKLDFEMFEMNAHVAARTLPGWRPYAD
jgi:hypothetical protein